MKTHFYVYEHWRSDDMICFYVGKGKGKRAFSTKRRNIHYTAIVQKLLENGYSVLIKLVGQDLDEESAFQLEKSRIKFWREQGVKLANKTDGGEGFSGFIRPKGIRLSEAAKEKVRAARLGMRFTTEHKKRLSAKKLGVKRKPFTPETREKMRLASIKRESVKRQLYGSDVRRTSKIKGCQR